MTTASRDAVDKAYKGGYNLAKLFKSGNMSSAEVKHATQNAYGRYGNNQKLKDAFKRGYGAGAQ